MAADFHCAAAAAAPQATRDGSAISTFQAKSALSRRAVLHMAQQQACRQRAALIRDLDECCVEANGASDRGDFARAAILSLKSNEVRVQVRNLTDLLDKIQNELDEPEGVEASPKASAVPALTEREIEQHRAVDDTAQLEAA